MDMIDATESSNSIVPYTREIFDALCLRYEEPIANNRWDSPLFTILPETEIPFEDIYSALYERKPPPPNLATQNVSMPNEMGFENSCCQAITSIDIRIGSIKSKISSHLNDF